MKSNIKLLRISKRNSTYQVLQALKTSRAKRNELKEIFVESIAGIKSAALANKIIKKFIFKDYNNLSRWAKNFIADVKDAHLIELSSELYHELCDKNEPSELLAIIQQEKVNLEQSVLSDSPFILVIDRPGNHGNLGSIIRSAVAFEVDMIVTLGHCVDMFDPSAIRASMGGIFMSRVCHEPSIKVFKSWINNLKKTYPDLAVISTDSEAEMSLAECNEISRPLLLLIGNETNGLSAELKAIADKTVKIPIDEKIESLNVACAASIFMYEISNRLSRSKQIKSSGI